MPERFAPAYPLEMNLKTVVLIMLVVLANFASQASAARKMAAPIKSKTVKEEIGAAQAKQQHAVQLSNPDALIAARTQKVLALLKSRPVRSLNGTDRETEVNASATKSGFIQAVYAQKLVEASWPTEMLADKRIFSEVLTRELGAERARALYPKTLGLREFLFAHHFLNAAGELNKEDVEEIEAALYEEFPNGFVARVAVGVSPRETSQGLYTSTDAFLVDLLKPGTDLYKPGHAAHAVTSHILKSIASGEAVVLQENIVAAADLKKPLKQKFYQEVRVHTYESKVVAGAVPSRWIQKEILTKAQIGAAENFVAEFLKQLPVSLLNRQAWSLDVAVMDNGEMRIADIVTNRGEKVAWSSYLEQPQVIAAYAEHFEANNGIHFAGFSGWLIRHGFANYFPYWQMKIQKARPGITKVLAYLPPWPLG